MPRHIQAEEVDTVDGLEPLGYRPRPLVYEDCEPIIKELHRQEKTDELILQPEFQRLSVWDTTKSSQLIESALLKIPLPLIYLAETNEGKKEVVDGQQRLRAFFDFLDNALTLQGLTSYPEYNGMTYKQIPTGAQTEINNTSIKVVLIKEEADPEAKFDIFQRLNRGAVPLNDQELRNCLYRGKYNNFINTIAENRTFLKLYSGGKPNKRMKDKEIVLRLFAFYHSTGSVDYSYPMRRFLNKEMEKYRDIDDDGIQRLTDFFEKSIDLSNTVFGEYAFSRFIADDERDKNGQWEPRFNKALFEVVMYAFKGYEKRDIVPKSDSIREGLIHLMAAGDNYFENAISIRTDKPEAVEQRFTIWREEVKKIVGTPKREPRCFSLAYKKQLHTTNGTCKKCNQTIQTIDDAEVDHEKEYWRGGETIPSNARLLHRYCNRARRNKIEPTEF